MENKEVKIPNTFRIELVDNTNLNQYNESFAYQREWYGEQATGEILDIETYYTLCREGAAAMGFCEATIDEWFGEY